MKKKGVKLLSFLILAVIALFLFAGNYFYDQGIKRGTEVELHSEAGTTNVLASEKDQKMVEEAKSWFKKQDLKELEITSFDGLKLKGFLFQNDVPEKKAVILAHGFRQEGKDMGKYAKMYADKGYDVLMPDARGHGASEGDYYGFGWHDRLDQKQWIDLLIQEYGEENIVLHGHSMGAATVLATSGEELPSEVKAIIADSSYSTVKKELAHQLKNIYKLPASPLLEVTSAVTKVRAGWTFEEADILSQTAKNTRPLLLIHGDTDDLVPTDMVYELEEASKSSTDIWIVPETGHTKAFDNHTEEFEKRLSDFLAAADL